MSDEISCPPVWPGRRNKACGELFTGDAHAEACLSRAAAKHTTVVSKRKCTTGVMGDCPDLGVSVGTRTVGRGPWEDYGPACSGADDAEASCRLPLRR